MRHLLIVTTESPGCCFSNDFCLWFVVLVVCPRLLSLLLWFDRSETLLNVSCLWSRHRDDRELDYLPRDNFTEIL